MYRLHLASHSPRRRKILSAMRLTFTFAGVDVDETRLAGEPAVRMVERLAVAKARAAVAREDIVLAADTVVALDEQVFGKPRSEAEAADMLAALAGRTHQVYTGVAMVSGSALATAISLSEVRFRDIDPAEAREYWHSGEPKDKAGGYAIQGLGGTFVRELRGSYSGVVGLPMYETAALLATAGIDVLRRQNSR